ncbi:MAG: hypothetical protein R3E66_02735 [bacterium]
MKLQCVVSASLVLTVCSSVAFAQDVEPVAAPSVEEAQSQVEQAVVEAETTPEPPANAPVPTEAPADEGAELSAEEFAAINASLAADAPVDSAPAVQSSGGAASANPDISLILDVAGAYFSDTPDVRRT